MIPYAVKTGYIKPKHLAMLDLVERIVNGLIDGLTCHEVCRLIVDDLDHYPGDHAGLVVRKGKFRGLDHSWLEFEGEQVVLDPYPWASARPMLVCLHGMSPWQWLYVADEEEKL